MIFLLLTWGREELRLRGVGLGSPWGGAAMSRWSSQPCSCLSTCMLCDPGKVSAPLSLGCLTGAVGIFKTYFVQGGDEGWLHSVFSQPGPGVACQAGRPPREGQSMV